MPRAPARARAPLIRTPRQHNYEEDAARDGAPPARFARRSCSHALLFSPFSLRHAAAIRRQRHYYYCLRYDDIAFSLRRH